MSKEVKKMHDADLDAMELVTLAEMANMAGEQAEAGMKRTVEKAADAGRYLEAAKRQVKHGEWLAWLGKNWNYSQQTASEFIQIANYGRARNLTEVASCRDALRLIYAEKAAKNAESGATVEVIEPVKDNDPAPKPPTNRTTAAGSRRTSETSRPSTPPLTPEIVDPEEDETDPVDDWFSCRSLEDVVLRWLGPLEDATARNSAGKHLRKLADKFDPPDADKIPTRTQLINAIPDTWSDSLKQAAGDWAAYKQARKKDDRIQSLRAWQIALNQMTDQPEAVVVHKVNNAIANSYKGWNHDSGNANGTGRNAAAAVNGRPPVQRAKINYK